MSEFSLFSPEYRVLNGLSDLVDGHEEMLDAGADDLDANAQQDKSRKPQNDRSSGSAKRALCGVRVAIAEVNTDADQRYADKRIERRHPSLGGALIKEIDLRRIPPFFLVRSTECQSTELR
jgi:hypothetical protein